MRGIVEDEKRDGKKSIDFTEWIHRIGVNTRTICGPV